MKSKFILFLALNIFPLLILRCQDKGGITSISYLQDKLLFEKKIELKNFPTGIMRKRNLVAKNFEENMVLVYSDAFTNQDNTNIWLFNIAKEELKRINLQLPDSVYASILDFNKKKRTEFQIKGIALNDTQLVFLMPSYLLIYTINETVVQYNKTIWLSDFYSEICFGRNNSIILHSKYNKKFNVLKVSIDDPSVTTGLRYTIPIPGFVFLGNYNFSSSDNYFAISTISSYSIYIYNKSLTPTDTIEGFPSWIEPYESEKEVLMESVSHPPSPEILDRISYNVSRIFQLLFTNDSSLLVGYTMPQLASNSVVYDFYIRDEGKWLLAKKNMINADKTDLWLAEKVKTQAPLSLNDTADEGDLPVPLALRSNIYGLSPMIYKNKLIIVNPYDELIRPSLMSIGEYSEKKYYFSGDYYVSISFYSILSTQ